ncbi:MAG: bifunctional (p)ppGpp synthetase/guanosine-3',5'-bis(diphosphate) 3'-pyrophosphohydrolase [Chloroflexi bacterium]|nr:bifunctional (p)ppGpp synthetase/guanosine-3',5'-bis(diphosphate) 3'-pyrophosphohydrolase [Chloroflexota bacterium]
MVDVSAQIAQGQRAEAEQLGLTSLSEKVAYLPADKLPLLRDAYSFAAQAHAGQQRESGEPFIIHPLSVAITLAEIQMDFTTLTAALLHDVVEDAGAALADLESRFGLEVSQLVDGCTKLSQLPWPPPQNESPEIQAENLRKMLVAMAQDIRVVFIKLADRLHNMRTLGALSAERQQTIARETMEIYAPLAHRLGMWEIKAELEDLAFFYIEPGHYQQIANQVASHRPMWETLIRQVSQMLKEEMAKSSIKAEVNGRPKHLYSIHRKMEKYAAQGKGFADIHDFMALRVIVDTVPDCYSALGIIHSLWHPIPGELNDYISSPKSNGYRSLHTTVMAFGTPLEIQVRTWEMHRLAEYGLAAHWRYKRGDSRDQRFEERIAWLRQLMEWHREFSQTEEFLQSVKTDIFEDQVYVYTPKGAIKELPAGSTPLDFAYTVHTDLGHRCVGAKVNGRLVPLNTALNNGDTVEVVTSKNPRGPSRDWINPSLGFVKTSHARDKIRQWFRKQAKEENVERGRQLLEKELRRLGLMSSKLEDLAALFQYEDSDDFLVAVGCGEITPHQIAIKLTDKKQEAPAETATQRAPAPTGIRVQGVGDLLTLVGKCCRPIPGDEIVGFITRARGVTIHRADCRNIVRAREKERLVDVEWGHKEQFYPATVQVRAWNRVGLLRDISAIVAEERVNMPSVVAKENSDHTASIFLTVETRDIGQLAQLLARIEGIKGIISAERSAGAGGG